VIGTLRLIPKFSVLSFTQKYLEQTGNKYAASQRLISKFDSKTMKYSDLDRAKEYERLAAKPKEFVSKNQPNVGLECLIKEIVGVPDL
jgi:hypothetical protein